MSIAILVEGIKVVFSLIGAISANFINFILPAAIYLKIISMRAKNNQPYGKNRFLEITAWISIVFGVVSMIIGLTVNIINWFH